MSEHRRLGGREIVVVGRGRLGRSLAGALGCTLLPGRGTSEVPSGSLCLLAVPDTALEEIAELLSTSGADLVHVSGSYGLDVLNPALSSGVQVGALHPLQSFPVPRGPESFIGIFFAIDASSEELLHELEDVATQIGGWSGRIQGFDRLRYHATGMFVGPLLTALASVVVDRFCELGLPRDQALRAILPFMRGTVDTLETLGLPFALIGPVRRGDARTVARHLSVLEGDEREIYVSLIRRSLLLAEECSVSPASLAAIRSLL